MSLTLTAAKRILGTRGDRSSIRKDKKILGIVFGHGDASTPISVDSIEFAKVFAVAGTSSIISLHIDGSKTPMPVIVSDIQRNPLTDRIMHVDLHALRMDEKLKAHVSLRIIGEAPAVKELGANLIISKDSLTIECLPKDLIPSLDVDVSSLVAFDQSIRIKDLTIPVGITVLDDPDESIVSALAPREEKVVETTATETETVQPELSVERGKAEPTSDDTAAA